MIANELGAGLIAGVGNVNTDALSYSTCVFMFFIIILLWLNFPIGVKRLHSVSFLPQCVKFDPEQKSTLCADDNKSHVINSLQGKQAAG
jgi:hypothetical protein